VKYPLFFLLALSLLTLNCGSGTQQQSASPLPPSPTPTAAPSTVVAVKSPTDKSLVSSPVTFTAKAITTCPKGVAIMNLYTQSGKLAYSVKGTSLNDNVTLDAGVYDVIVEAIDRCGNKPNTPVTITVATPPAPTPAPPPAPLPPPSPTVSGTSFTNVQASKGWGQYAQGPPDYVDCSPSPCNGITFSMSQGIKNPSLSGNAMQAYLRSQIPFGDSLWVNRLIGDYSTQGLPDSNHTLIPSLHDFTYDVYFYGDNLGLAQALEFDINQFFGGMGFIFGHECRIASGHEWDIFDNQKRHWVSTGIPCWPNDHSWNHVIIKVQRTSSNELLYQSITLNWTFANSPAPGWYGVTINYQQDQTVHPTPYSIFLDQLTFTYQ
jgi:hypothetical protein